MTETKLSEEDYKLAEQFATKECCATCKNINHYCKEKCECWTFAKNGLLAGLKAGRPKWHKVADGDYPPCEKGNYTINVLTDREDIAYYDYNENCWVAEPSSVEIDSPIAWCEIPKYTEE